MSILFNNSKGGNFWGDTGAGVLVVCKTTKRFLLAHRSPHVNEPNTWGIFGGSIDKNEKPEEAAKRELVEEAGYNGHFEIIPAYIFNSNDKTFTYFNFIGLVDTEFEATLDWETQDTKWCTFEEVSKIKNKHFGLVALLNNSQELIKTVIHDKQIKIR